ncbi:hypothetical protein EV122DRAFT_294258 [Schizophyllum commune]
MSSYRGQPGLKPSMPKKLDPFSKPERGTVTIRSSDNRILYVDRNSLECHAKGILNKISGGIAFLGEDASTLELLFRIVYQEKGVRLDRLEFPRLLLLAEAATRYGAYAAFEKCGASMKSHSKSHALQVMEYAAKYEYAELLDVAAVFSVGLSPAEVSRALPANEPHFAAWIFYTDQYSKLMRQMTQSQYASCVCASCVEKVAYMAMLRGPGVLVHLDDMFSQALYMENIYCKRRKDDTAGFTIIHTSDDDFAIPHQLLEELDCNNLQALSSDDTLFYVNRNRLCRNTKNLLQRLVGEATLLNENAVTLECLFRIVDEEKCVQLELLPFRQLLLLAEAAEKYGAYAASMLCCSALKSHGKDHTLEVMAYAARYGHVDVLDAAAPFSVSFNPAVVRRMLPTAHFEAWGMYVNQHQHRRNACPLAHWQSRYSACACVHDTFKVACHAVLSDLNGQAEPNDLCPRNIWQSGRCAEASGVCVAERRRIGEGAGESQTDVEFLVVSTGTGTAECYECQWLVGS